MINLIANPLARRAGLGLVVVLVVFGIWRHGYASGQRDAALAVAEGDIKAIERALNDPVINRNDDDVARELCRIARAAGLKSCDL